MATPNWEMHYDRRVAPGFLAHLMTGGVAAALAEYARGAPYPVDLQLRHDVVTGADHATLYVGLTGVLTLRARRGGCLSLGAHETHQAGPHGFDRAWTAPMTVELLAERWRGVEDYLERVIVHAAAVYASSEGAVQSAASTFATGGRLMLDREVVLGFRDTPTRTAVFAEVVAPVVSALHGAPVKGRPPSSFGGELDLLAVDTAGRLLTVEVKPKGASTLRWAAAQATVYARLWERWLAAGDLPDPAGEVLDGMAAQRAALGLSEPRPPSGTPTEVVPVVAVQRGASPVLQDDLRAVQQTLLDQGVGHTGLELCEVALSGRLTPLPL